MLDKQDLVNLTTNITQNMPDVRDVISVIEEIQENTKEIVARKLSEEEKEEGIDNTITENGKGIENIKNWIKAILDFVEFLKEKEYIVHIEKPKTFIVVGHEDEERYEPRTGVETAVVSEICNENIMNLITAEEGFAEMITELSFHAMLLVSLGDAILSKKD